jgi:hypothetical protein
MKILEYIRSKQPLLNVAELERLVGERLSIGGKRTLYKALNGSQELPTKWVIPIASILCEKFGNIEIDGWTIWKDEHDFFREKRILEIQDEIIEHEEKEGIWIEYKSSFSRDVFDDFDFIEFLS